MNGKDRRNKILNIIMHRNEPIKAKTLGEMMSVSRQVIVGDIALLRAEGHDIFASDRGYLMHYLKNRYVAKVAVDHSEKETETELRTLVDLGIHILDVSVDHKVYGILSGQLNIKTHEDIDAFMNALEAPLSALTQGVHVHTLSCPNEASYQDALRLLDNLNILIRND